LATSADDVDDGEEFSSDVTNGYAVMFMQLMPVVMVNFCKAGLVQAGHAGSLIQSGTQSDAATFTHFDFAAPLAAFTHPWIHAGIGQ
jgi:hypothetical protein